jgi:hypothetical protein
MPPIIVNREFIDRWTRVLRSIVRLSASALLHPSPSSVAFITNIAESHFWYTQMRSGINHLLTTQCAKSVERCR